MACNAPALDAGFVGGLLNYADCQAQAIGAGGYQALAAPGSSLSLTLTGLLTLFVALFGYRMLFGQIPNMRDGVLALVKIGIVLALATGWAAYRTLVYDVAFKAPAEIATDIGRPAALPGAGGGLAARLDNADRLLVVLSEWGTGVRPATEGATPPPPYLIPGGATGVPPPGAQNAADAGSFDSLAFGGARILFLTGAAGALAIVRLIAGLLLAVAPFFVAFLLFDATRGLFAGWLRVLGGVALGALGASVLLGVQLAFIEPRIVNLIAVRAAGYSVPGAAIELFAIMLIFALALVAMLVALARVVYGFRFPSIQQLLPGQWSERAGGDRPINTNLQRDTAAAPAAERSRAAAVADAVAASQRREAPLPAAAMAATAGAAGGPSRTTVVTASNPRDSVPGARPAPQPLGQSGRRTRNRTSSVLNRRDGAS